MATILENFNGVLLIFLSITASYYETISSFDDKMKMNYSFSKSG